MFTPPVSKLETISPAGTLKPGRVQELAEVAEGVLRSSFVLFSRSVAADYGLLRIGFQLRSRSGLNIGVRRRTLSARSTIREKLPGYHLPHGSHLSCEYELQRP